MSRLPSADHRAAAERGSSGTAASRWLTMDDSTVTSHPERSRPGSGRVGHRQLECEVGAGRVVDQRGIGGRVGQRHHRRLWIDVDEDVLGCVGGRGGRLGHHHRHRLAHEPDGVAGQHRAGHPLVDHWNRLQVGQVQVGRGEHPEHSGLLPGLGRVHAGQAPAAAVERTKQARTAPSMRRSAT